MMSSLFSCPSFFGTCCRAASTCSAVIGLCLSAAPSAVEKQLRCSLDGAFDSFRRGGAARRRQQRQLVLAGEHVQKELGQHGGIARTKLSRFLLTFNPARHKAVS